MINRFIAKRSKEIILWYLHSNNSQEKNYVSQKQ